MSYRQDLLLDNEAIARMLAATAGVEWTELRDYPGYGKNYWREQARRLFARGIPARFAA
ncbi:hypothetical protein [uncultured Parasphingopyxis sp.]|uniref:hypothetical protein n=1 Tax=uncultured Parasphingopyxis sp. TaxID=1547918 RepID=UPI002616D5E0|nr:hypothetical protein [uncultured Parasphingopyxis sp.]